MTHGASHGADADAVPSFLRTVDVLELVADAVSFGGRGSVASLLALRGCSRACAAAVSGALHNAAPKAEAANEGTRTATGAMPLSIAESTPAARLCVVAQAHGTVRHWLRDVPAAVFPCMDSDRVIEDIWFTQRYVPHLRSVAFRHQDIPVVDRDVVDALTSSEEVRTSLEALTFDSLEVELGALEAAAAALPELRKLVVTGCLVYCLTEALVAVACGCKKLEHLDLYYTDSEGNLRDEALIAIAESCPNLAYLDLQDGGEGYITDASLLAIARCCPRLKVLGTGMFIGSLSDAGVTAVLRGCPELTALRLPRCGITDETLIEVGRRCPNLSELDVYYPTTRDGVTDRGVIAVAEGCPTLTSLGVMATKITDAAVLAVGRGCPRLEKLDVRQCEAVTAAAVAAIKQSCPRLVDVQHDTGTAS